MTDQIREVEKKIFSTFSDVASSIGYSPLHGHIIGVLLVKGKPLSLQDLAKETGYSSSMISLSLDLLQILGVVKKIKRAADRKLYVELTGDLLEALKHAVLTKLSKSIATSIRDFEEGRKALQPLQGPERDRVLKTIQTLETQIKRLKTYVDLLSKAGLP
ncbi:MAG: hypothetical protein HY369_04410 [Candidatus Aenigmarchaeota archaeon]|nr:hypothetical protein [Candidatus Aenigmarchaeota archaeon]